MFRRTPMEPPSRCLHLRNHRRVAFLGLLAALVCAGATSLAIADEQVALPVLDWEQCSDWISVKNHGALGDGKADDTAAIQRTLDEARSGVTLYFPSGDYRITRTLQLPNKNPKTAKPYKLLVQRGADPDELVPQAMSLSIIGHGRASRLVWDGHSGYPLMQTEGMTHSRIVGLNFVGSHRASIGLYWCSLYTFGTNNRFRHCGFQDFLAGGFLLEWHEPTRALANAETSFENCLFVNCGTGASFQQFNDYNYTFVGCEFRRCRTGILSRHGNFYARNCHFEGSAIADIQSYCEHGSTVRRCTSLNSNRFIEHSNVVSPLVVEGCTVRKWRDPNGAVQVNGAPVMLFDNTFVNHAIPQPLAKGAIRFYNEANKVLILSENRIVKLGELVAQAERVSELPNMAVADTALPLTAEAWPEREHSGRVFTIPAGQRQGLRMPADTHFLKSTVAVPGKVFDAKRDFGARGDRKTDDSAAIQQAIDAAKNHGKGAIAYLPAGTYLVEKTLTLSGGDYFFGGAGILSTRLEWRGASDKPTIEVVKPQRLTLCDFGVARSDAKAPDILQEAADGESFVIYDGVSVTGRPRMSEPPFAGGLCCRNLGPQETILAPFLKGSLRFFDCAQATILIPISYYGSVIIEGNSPKRDGFFGMQTRFNSGKWDFLVKDNHSLIISDYYTESAVNGLILRGEDGAPPGRVTLQGAKIACTETWFDIENYQGHVFFGPQQFCHRSRATFRLRGDRAAELFLIGNTFYRPPVDRDKSGPSWIYHLGSWPIGTEKEGERLSPEAVRQMFADNVPADRMATIAAMLDDLRRLGAVDLKLNHLAVYKAVGP